MRVYTVSRFVSENTLSRIWIKVIQILSFSVSASNSFIGRTGAIICLIVSERVQVTVHSRPGKLFPYVKLFSNADCGMICHAGSYTSSVKAEWGKSFRGSRQGPVGRMLDPSLHLTGIAVLSMRQKFWNRPPHFCFSLHSILSLLPFHIGSDGFLSVIHRLCGYPLIVFRSRLFFQGC